MNRTVKADFPTPAHRENPRERNGQNSATGREWKARTLTTATDENELVFA